MGRRELRPGIVLASAVLVLLVIVSALISGCVGKDEVIGRSVSPDGNWTVVAYSFDPGAMASGSVYAVAIDREGHSRRIYTDWDSAGMDISWESDTLVRINGHLIDVRHGLFR